MSKFKNTLKSKYYWIAKGQGKIFGMLKEQVIKRGDSAKLAKKIGSTPAYVSQILSGDTKINPTWKKIVKFCLALDKVPVLEIKDIDEYLIEEKLKASFSNYCKLFEESCSKQESESINELNTSDHLELDDFAFLIPNEKNKKANSETILELQYDNYELI